MRPRDCTMAAGDLAVMAVIPPLATLKTPPVGNPDVARWAAEVERRRDEGVVTW